MPAKTVSFICLLFTCEVICFALYNSYNSKARDLLKEVNSQVKNETTETLSPDSEEMLKANELGRTAGTYLAAGVILSVILIFVLIIITGVFLIEYADARRNRVRPDRSMPEVDARDLELPGYRPRPLQRPPRIAVINRRPRERDQPDQVLGHPDAV